MARTTTDIVYGVSGQSLAIRVMQGRPSSAAFSVFDDFENDDATPQFSGTATVDAVNTTIDAASGSDQSDPQRINLTSTSDISVGRKYLIAENSLSEWVDPIEIVSGSHIRVRYPLRNAYSTSATFVGATITALVDSTWVADEANISDLLDPNPDYRVRWDVIVGSETHVAYSYFDLVRATVTHQIDIGDLNERAPGLADSLPIDYQRDQGRSLIDSAFRSVQAKLASLRIDTDAIRDVQPLDELTILRALYMLAMGGWKPLGMTSAEYIAETRTDYDRFVEQHVQVTLSVPLASGSSSGADAVRVQPYWSK